MPLCEANTIDHGLDNHQPLNRNHERDRDLKIDVEDVKSRWRRCRFRIRFVRSEAILLRRPPCLILCGRPALFFWPRFARLFERDECPLPDPKIRSSLTSVAATRSLSGLFWPDIERLSFWFPTASLSMRFSSTSRWSWSPSGQAADVLVVGHDGGIDFFVGFPMLTPRLSFCAASRWKVVWLMVWQ